MAQYPVIIVGAGIGGLTTAAYLSKLGIPSLLLEQTTSIGGRCSSRTINGQEYEIGALYVGGGAFDHLRETFGVECQTIPIRCGVKVRDHLVSFPVGWKTLLELRSCGVPWLDLIRFQYRSRMLADPSTFVKYESVGQVFDMLVGNSALRQFFDAAVGVSGISPFRLSSQSLRKEGPVARYKTLNPEYMVGGNVKISYILFDLAQEHCEVILNARVNKILVREGRAIGVSTSQGEFSGQVVVSNAGLQTTVLRLTDFENWQADYYSQVRELERTLQVVNVFLTFSRSLPLPSGFAIFFVCDDVNSEFESLEKGFFPSQSMFILHVPSNVEVDSRGDHRATLQFYYPRDQVSFQSLNDQVQKVMNDGLERLLRGFSKAITSYSVYDPMRYEQEFGFSPHVFGVSPALDQLRFPTHTPIPNLFCVGDSVQPAGPCVPQAMESGIAGAQMVARYLGAVPVTHE
jgi:phytoene dehydrogenase-like protein